MRRSLFRFLPRRSEEVSESVSVLGGVAGVMVTIEVEAGILGSLLTHEGGREDEADTEGVECERGHDGACVCGLRGMSGKGAPAAFAVKESIWRRSCILICSDCTEMVAIMGKTSRAGKRFLV